jgi:cytochrome P450
MQSFPFDRTPAEDVDPTAVRLLATAPVVRAEMPDGRQVWLALSRDAVREVLSDNRFSRVAAVVPGGPGQVVSAADPDVLTSMDPPKHTRVRKLMARAFSPRMVEALEPRVREIVAELLDGVAAHGRPADLVKLFAEPLPITVICELLGVPVADQDMFRDWAMRLVSTTRHSRDEIMATVAQVRGYFAELVAAKRVEPGDDLTSELVRVTDDEDALTETELLANLQILLIAGHETTVNQLGNSLVALFRNPDQLALLRDRPELAATAVDELLRYARLATEALPRVTVTDVELVGVPIKAGEAVVPLPGAASQDPGTFPEPDRLDLARPNAAQHLAFGHGFHFCLGAQLARTELRIALTGLLARFPALRLATGESELSWRAGTPARALEALPVTW